MSNAVAAEIGNLHTALASEIDQASPEAKHIAVLNYYQILPSPQNFAKSSGSQRRRR